MDGNSSRLLASIKSDLRVGDNSAHDVTVIICYALEGAFLSLNVSKALFIVGVDFPRSMVATIRSDNMSTTSNSSCIWSEDDREKWINSLTENPFEEDLRTIKDRKLNPFTRRLSTTVN